MRRNVVEELLPWLRKLGMTVVDSRTAQVLTVRFGRQENEFYLFGGKDEGSAALIQGMTLAGVFLDEVVLMPRSFVEQACARCSVEGAGCGSAAIRRGRSTGFIRSGSCRRIKELPAPAFYDAGQSVFEPDSAQTVRAAVYGCFYRRFIWGNGARPRDGCTTSLTRRACGPRREAFLNSGSSRVTTER